MKRQRGSTLAVLVIVIVLLGALGYGVVYMGATSAAGHAPDTRAAQAVYTAEAGAAVAAKTQAAQGATSFAGGTFQVAKAGNLYTATTTVNGKTVRQLEATIVPAGAQSPIDESGSAATATTDEFDDPNAGEIEGGDKEVVMKVINTGSTNLVIASFSVATTTPPQPKLKELHLRTPLNDWERNRVWKEGSGVDLPTGDLVPDEGTANDITIPANSYIIVDQLKFKDDINGDSATFTLVLKFTNGQSATMTFTVQGED